ncbi:3'-5' exonuclease [Vibrio parahaemolyticus]|uniref:3'-5' exonuclease n=1 Tax=Vibrio parahaemolyticus TaxID=670 RepID=UPI00215CDB84|nr:3'-5' exonuclease [Vibrio parahaemolyticus]MCR9713906.1 3'-5' exoribonuclease [Vibrio parahaemolyticus]
MSENTNTVVIDTETLDTQSTAVVLTVSAVRFNRYRHGLNIEFERDGALKVAGSDQIHVMVNVTEQLIAGRTVSASTAKWWREQGQAAKDSVMHGLALRVEAAMDLLTEFIGDAQVYCRGTDFDPPILASLYRMVGKKSPWKYNQVRDVRTYIDARSGGTKGYLDEWVKPEWLIAHNSLHDCIRDALQMQQAGAPVCAAETDNAK